ncbi:MAG: hypothetical protein EOP32_03225 [Rhodococcus sp. (in: high G+C Gram-positive bacteria)]|nr:MAG: hypothetical protein EOP32_03225 [Rhodococcus sp. (in: high G+C Gram-positive bacteria)]
MSSDPGGRDVVVTESVNWGGHVEDAPVKKEFDPPTPTGVVKGTVTPRVADAEPGIAPAEFAK